MAAPKLIFALYSLKLGGAERQAINLMKWLQGRGYRIDVLSLTDDGPGGLLLKEAGISYKCLGFDLYHNQAAIDKNLRTLRRIFRWRKPQAVVGYTYWPNVLLSLAAKDLNVPALWNQRDEGLTMEGKPIEQQALDAATQIIANSPGGLAYLTKHYNVHEPKCHVVANGVALPSAQLKADAWRSKLSLGKDQALVCMIANIHFYKDHPTVVKAWAYVRDAFPEKTPMLVLAGRVDFADRQKELEQIIEAESLQDCVKMIGATDDISGLLEAADLAVFSSPHEGCPNGVIEPMSKGLAVVASDTSGVREAFSEEYSGLTPFENAKAMGEKVVALLMNPEERQQLGAQNKSTAEARYSREKTGLAFLKIAGLSER